MSLLLEYTPLSLWSLAQPVLPAATHFLQNLYPSPCPADLAALPPLSHPRNVPSSGSLRQGTLPRSSFTHSQVLQHLLRGLPVCMVGHPADLAVPLRKSLDSLMPIPCLSAQITSLSGLSHCLSPHIPSPFSIFSSRVWVSRTDGFYFSLHHS